MGDGGREERLTFTAVPVVRFALCSIAVLGAVACIGGEVVGGQALPVIAEEGMSDCTTTAPACSTWTNLYACYFGPNLDRGGGCSAMSTCHATTTGNGYAGSGFVCGPSADSCYRGVTGATEEANTAVLVHASDAGAGTDLSLQAALHRTMVAETGAVLTGNNMPLQNLDTQAPAYLFTPADIAFINGWVKAGAPEN